MAEAKRAAAGGRCDEAPAARRVDDVRNVEQLDLYLAADVLGTEAAERIEFHQVTAGLRIDAAGGDDVVQGGLGDDVVGGGTGNDEVDSSYGHDTIDPGPGRDTVFADLKGGDCGPLWCTGEYGNDTVNARDGEVDSIVCGVGADRVVADADDVVAPDCETVERAAPAPAPRSQTGAQPQPDGRSKPAGNRRGGRPGRATATLRPASALKLRTVLERGLPVRVSGLRAGARVALSARVGATVVAHGRARAGRAGKATVTLRFTSSAKRALRGKRRIALTIAGAGTRERMTLRR